MIVITMIIIIIAIFIYMPVVFPIEFKFSLEVPRLLQVFS